MRLNSLLPQPELETNLFTDLMIKWLETCENYIYCTDQWVLHLILTRYGHTYSTRHTVCVSELLCASSDPLFRRKGVCTATRPSSWRRWSWSRGRCTRRRSGWPRTAPETTARIHSRWVSPSESKTPRWRQNLDSAADLVETGRFWLLMEAETGWRTCLFFIPFPACEMWENICQYWQKMWDRRSEVTRNETRDFSKSSNRGVARRPFAGLC